MKMTSQIIRTVLGAFLLLMGVNKFIPFLPPMDLAAPAADFMMALVSTGYMMPMVATVEILSGLMLLFPVTAPLGTLLLAPLSVNIVLFHLFLDVSSGVPAFLVALTNVGLGIHYFEFYRSIFARIFDEKVLIKTHGRVVTVQ